MLRIFHIPVINNCKIPNKKRKQKNKQLENAFFKASDHFSSIYSSSNPPFLKATAVVQFWILLAVCFVSPESNVNFRLSECKPPWFFPIQIIHWTVAVSLSALIRRFPGFISIQPLPGISWRQYTWVRSLQIFLCVNQKPVSL